MTSEQLQLTFNIINALGSIGTLGAFIFLFLKDRAKEKQIQALTEVVKLLAEQNKISEKRLRLTVTPDLWLNGAGYKGMEGELQIDLNNKGETAYLDNIRLISGDIVLHNLAVPYELEQEQRRYIFGRAKPNKHIKDCEYEVEVEYHDKLNYTFSLIIKGKGAEAKIISNNEVKN